MILDTNEANYVTRFIKKTKNNYDIFLILLVISNFLLINFELQNIF